VNDTRTIFFVGKPGCGKGTQAKLLSELTGWPVFGSGKLFRELAAEDTAVGHKLKRENDAGNLQPHWFAMYLYLKSLFSVKEGVNVIFDGFNRKLPEAELIISSLKWLERPFSVVHIEVSDDEVRRRLAERGKTSGRADDQAVDERMKEFHEHTEPAIRLFREAGVLLDVDGEQEPAAILAVVKEKLDIA
jgi:adenylate kinase